MPWWNPDLLEKRKEARRLFNRAMLTRLDSDWDHYRRAQRQFKSLIRQYKKNAWKDFCESIEDLPTTSRVYKLLGRNHDTGLDALRLPDGTFTCTAEETLEHLVNHHFPESDRNAATVQSRRTPHIDTSAMAWRTASNVATYERIRWAIYTFAPHKSAGLDEIFPALLQQGSEIIIQQLHHLLTATLALGYIPISWRTARVIFIPKAGRPTHDDVTAFRPICLT